jgi:hypothetical protein
MCYDMLEILFYPEDGEIMFLRNIVKLTLDYIASHLRKYKLM